MPSAILGNVAGAVVGGLMGGDDEQTQTQNRDPWAPAQPWLKQNLQTGQNLQGYYEQNPFNSIQQTAYQNMASDMDNYRSNINPGLMEFANKLMGTNYSRTGGQQMPRNQSMGQSSPLAYGTQTRPMQAQGGPFVAGPSQSYGLLNFAELNPFTAKNGVAKTPAAAAPAAAPVDDANKPYNWRDELDRITSGRQNPYGEY